MSERINYLTIQNMEEICYELAKFLFNDTSDPMPAFQYLHKDMMESALEGIKFDYYKDIFEKAGEFGFRLIKGHSLLDGNKRIGITATMIFLMANKYFLDVKVGDILKEALGVADNKICKVDFTKWLRDNCVPLTKIKGI